MRVSVYEGTVAGRDGDAESWIEKPVSLIPEMHAEEDDARKMMGPVLDATCKNSDDDGSPVAKIRSVKEMLTALIKAEVLKNIFL